MDVPASPPPAPPPRPVAVPPTPAAPPVRERALRLIRDNQPEPAVELLLPLLYRPGRIPMVEPADARDVAACAAAAVRAGMLDRAVMLAYDSAGVAPAVSALIHQAVADWKRSLTWK